MPSQWFYHNGREQKGPVTSVELRELVRRGAIRRGDFAWKEGLEGWIPCANIEGLFEDGVDTSASDPALADTDTNPPAARPLRPKKKSPLVNLDDDPDDAPLVRARVLKTKDDAPAQRPAPVSTFRPHRGEPPDPPPRRDKRKRDTVVVGSLGARIVASMIDNFLVTVLAGIAGGVVLLLMFLRFSQQRRDGETLTPFIGLYFLLACALTWAYHAIQNASENQGTVGKFALDLKIVQVDGEPINLGHATLRWMVQMAPALLASLYFSPVLIAIGVLFSFVNIGVAIIHPRHRAIHDFIAGTIVAKR